MSVLYFIAHYLLLIIALLVWFFLILSTEWLYTAAAHALLRKRWKNTYRKIFKLFRQNYSLLEQGYRKTIIFSLSMAFALLCVIFACLPSGVAIPIIENGGDLLQLLFMIMLSLGCVIVALEALNFPDKRVVFKKLIISVTRLYLPFIACFISIASYLETIGIAGDCFSLSLLVEATPYHSMSYIGLTGLCLFGFIIFSQIYSEDKAPGEDCMFISMSDMPEFSGKTRFILQLWSLCMPYLVILLVAEIIFPWKYFGNFTRGPLVALLITFAGFLVFWVGIIFLRIVVASICWSIMHMVKAYTSTKVYGFILPLLTLLAMGLVFYDSIKVAAEMIAY